MQTGIFQFLAPIRRRWWLIAMIVVPICVITAVISLFGATQYDGFMTITETQIGGAEKSTEIFPNMRMSAIDPETKMNNLMSTIGSFTVLFKSWEDLYRSGDWKPKSPGDPNDMFEDFANQIQIEPVRGTELIKIHFMADTPEGAQAGIRRLYSNFRDRYIELTSATSKREREFIEQQLQNATADFKAITEKRAKFLEAHDAVALQTATSNLVGLRSETQGQYNDAVRNIQMSEAAIRQYSSQRRSASVSPFKVQGETTTLNPVYDQLQRALASVDVDIASYGQTLGMNHPKMKELLKQRDQMQKEIRSLQAKNQIKIVSVSSTMNNPQLMAANSALDNAKAGLAAAESRAKVLTGQLVELDQKLNKIPAKERDLAQIEVEYGARQNDIQLLQTRLTEAKIKESDAQNIRVTMIDDVFSPVVPKKTLLKVALAFALSFALAVGLVLVLGQFDNGTYSPAQAENALGFPVIASLPRTRQAELPKDVDSPSPLSASYQIMSTNILETRNRMHGPGLVVTSAEPNVGRSTVAANLAVSLARDGARVVLIDGDMREPSLHRQFGVENRAGIADVLQGSAAVQDVAQETPVDGLLLITAGKPPTNPVRLLRDGNFERMLEQVAKAADFVIVDSPSGSTFADADVISGTIQNVLLVHEAGSPATPAEMEFHKRLERLGVNIVGVALNKVRPEDCHGYSSFKRSYEASLLGRELVDHSKPERAPQLDLPRQGRPPASTPPPIASSDDEDE